jgi:hypothetical protein
VFEAPQRNQSTKFFDEQNNQAQPLSEAYPDSKFYENAACQKHYRGMLDSYLDLYIFADEYAVHQLRDNILTAIVGQSNDWEYWPDPSEDLLAMTYGNLPSSASFLHLFALSTVFCWLPDPNEDAGRRLDRLRRWNAEFAMLVINIQTRMLQRSFLSGKNFTGLFEEATVNACMMHEHLMVSGEECRLRVKGKAHVFAGLVEACAKDAIEMVKEQEEDGGGGNEVGDGTEQSVPKVCWSAVRVHDSRGSKGFA